MNILLFSDKEADYSQTLHNKPCEAVAENTAITGTLTLQGDKLAMLKSLLRRTGRLICPDPLIRIGQIDGCIGWGRIESLSPHQARIAFCLNERPPPKLPLTLVVALPRPIMLRRILKTVTEVGVSKLVLLETDRVEKSYWQTQSLESYKLKQICLQGLTQSGDSCLPKIVLAKTFRSFVDQTLPSLLKDATGFVAHPGSEARYAQLLHSILAHQPTVPTHTSKSQEDNVNRHQVLFIGPERGFNNDEIDVFKKAGCQLISLGTRIVRVETAVSIMIGQYLCSMDKLALCKHSR